MNKQQEYFEKNIIPYRQKIRQLESENKDLRIENYTTRSINDELKRKIESKEQEIQSLLSIMNMSEEDRKTMLKSKKSLNEFASVMNSLNRAFN